MAQCFCGCRRKVRFSHRSVNTRGKQVRRRIGEADRVLGGVNGHSETLECFIAEGLLITRQLAEAVHGGYDPGSELESMSSDWQRQGREIGSNPMAALGQASRKSGMSPEEFAQAIVQGDFGGKDPFAFTLEVRRYPPSRDVLDPMVQEMRRELAERERAIGNAPEAP